MSESFFFAQYSRAFLCEASLEASPWDLLVLFRSATKQSGKY